MTSPGTRDRDEPAVEPRSWDGTPNATEKPFGATIVVYRRVTAEPEYLILHRAHSGPDFEGDWAWTPPAGARHPGEKIADCARRELLEEAGLTARLRRTPFGTDGWVVYMAEADRNAEVTLHDAEHDRFEWVGLSEAGLRCSPEVVIDGIRRVAELLSEEA